MTHPIRQHYLDAGYVQVQLMQDNWYVLTDKDGKQEIWFANPGHASYGVVLDDGTELEFVRGLWDTEEDHA